MIMTEPNKELVNLIKRQTDYSEQVILEKLVEHENDIERIILEYNGVNSNDSDGKISTNQKIFKAIRDNMNEVAMKKDSQK